MSAASRSCSARSTCATSAAATAIDAAPPKPATGGGPVSARTAESVDQQADRALELVDRRVLDAADAGGAIEPGVDLGVGAAVGAAQVRDKAVALVAQERAALEGGKRGVVEWVLDRGGERRHRRRCAPGR